MPLAMQGSVSLDQPSRTRPYGPGPPKDVEAPTEGWRLVRILKLSKPTRSNFEFMPFELQLPLPLQWCLDSQLVGSCPGVHAANTPLKQRIRASRVPNQGPRCSHNGRNRSLLMPRTPRAPKGYTRKKRTRQACIALAPYLQLEQVS